MGDAVRYSRRANADLVRLVAFIASENPLAARETVERLISRIELLANFPHVGYAVKGRYRQLILPYGKRVMLFGTRCVTITC